ncbi:hypothetical protein OE749_14445 [Aestuariibacter sp. AA17]|uniref:Uncharacterized protein n=1 Tax=Fluctibacter corallii TaxID=2984329 RepID=A0ABT3AB42_9ALTE|nr:hypothetical protein [Aestuariibacter sp. AA17]MCV2885895.1 hypothetical protein [Aestuariibacter sp. AA17]
MRHFIGVPSIFRKERGEKSIATTENVAMSLKEQSTQYKWSTIQPRHFVSKAKHYKYLVDNVDPASSKVEAIIPLNFPEYVASAIFDGLKK